MAAHQLYQHWNFNYVPKGFAQTRPSGPSWSSSRDVRRTSLIFFDFFLGLSLAPQITWSDPGLPSVQPQTSLVKSYWLTNDLLASKTVYKALYSYNKKFNTSIKYVQLDKLLGFKERFEYRLKNIPGILQFKVVIGTSFFYIKEWKCAPVKKTKFYICFLF